MEGGEKDRDDVTGSNQLAMAENTESSIENSAADVLTNRKNSPADDNISSAEGGMNEGSSDGMSKVKIKEEDVESEFSHKRFDITNSMYPRQNSDGVLPNKSVCAICGYRAGRLNHLTTHMRKHTGEKPYACNFCDYRAGAILTLRRHMRVHTGEKPYSCQVCEYRSAHLSDMKRHVAIHSGEKPHGCEMCSYRCACLKDLRRHMRTHTGEKPYCCAVCDYQASQATTLKAHMRVHTGEKPFACNFCEYRAGRASHVTRHMKVHSGEKRLIFTSEDAETGAYAECAEGTYIGTPMVE